MDSVKKKVVLDICEKIADAANSEALWHEKGPGGEYKRDPELEMTPDEATAAIMSAFKRVPGVVVSPLVWEHVEGAIDDGDAWFANVLNGLRYGVWACGADGFRWELESEDGDLGPLAGGVEDTKRAAQDACRDDLTSRITSALVPGVVSDARVDAACAIRKRRLMDTGVEVSVDKYWDDAKAALTAALSTSRSEEEREVLQYIRERADEEIAQINASIGRDEPTVTVDIHGGGIAGVDESIAPLVKLLNDGGIKTVASCSGHGHRPGNIALADGRELIIARNWNEARIIDGLFPGINGEPAKGVKGALEFIRQSNEEIKGDFERVLLDAITVSEFGDRAAAIRERIREVRRSLTNGGK